MLAIQSIRLPRSSGAWFGIAIAQQLRDSGGTGFWHETYLMQGGMEAIHNDVPGGGFMRFAQTQAARGTMFGAAHRMSQVDGRDIVVSEKALYGP
jgi:hypothetical protein